MTETAADYAQLVEEVYLPDGTVHKVGFQEGKWIARINDAKVAVSQSGFLLYLKYRDDGRAYSYDLFAEFVEMVTDARIDLCLMGQVATAIGADYIEFLD
jgi:hypothetical protein